MTSSTPSPSMPPSTSRSLKLLLVVSLVLNVFLLGAIGGGTYRWYRGAAAMRPVAAAPARALRFAAAGLAPARQQQFIEMLRNARRASAPQARAAREGRREVARLLVAPQLDSAALDAALAQTRAADIAIRNQLESGVAGFAATLTPEERITLAEGLGRWGSFRAQPVGTPASAR